MKKDTSNFNTLSIHSGEDKQTPPVSSVPAISMATSFLSKEEVSFSSENLEDDSPYLYTRWANPIINTLEEKIAALEGAESALALSSGMGACTSTMLSLLKSGDRLLVSDICYPGVREFCNTTLPNLNINVEAINMSDLEEVENALSVPTDLIFMESPCNPILRLTDLKAIVGMAKEQKITTVVDSTFATPIATQAIGLGVDLVIHSLTKYMNGHGDAMGGVIAGKKEHINLIRNTAVIHAGNVISPFNAWLINRGLATLPIRMKRHSENAMMIAERLEKHPNVKQVNYPGLLSHPQHNLAKRQMNLFSGMMSFQVQQNPKQITERMRKELQTIHYAVSLGHHKSLIYYLPTDDLQQSSYQLRGKNLADYRKFAGEGIFRLSVGLEDPEDIYKDLEKVLNT